MKIETKTSPSGIPTLVLEGDLDFHATTEVRASLAGFLNQQAKAILVDMEKTSYIDSSGLATFVEAYQKLKKSGGKLILFNLAPGVKSVFEIAKLDSLFKLASSEQEALKMI